MKRVSARLLFTAWLACTLTFFLLRCMPGDVVHVWASNLQAQDGISYAQARQQVEAMLNVETQGSALSQYFAYLAGLLQGNLGTSLVFKVPVSELIAGALPWTLLVTLGALALSFMSGVWWGLRCALAPGEGPSQRLRTAAVTLQSMPDFLVALLLLWIFAVQLGWLPLRGAYPPELEPAATPVFALAVLRYACLPILAFALPRAAEWSLAALATARRVRSEQFYLTAEAQGLAPRTLGRRFLLPHVLLPLLPALASSFGGMLGGVVLVEAMFGYPGIGAMLGRSIQMRDFPLIQGLFLTTTGLTLLATLAGEVASRRVDPRLR